MASESKQNPTASAIPPPTRLEAATPQAVPVVGGDPIRERGRQVVEAAYELLQERGLEGLTIRAVLNRTGLSRRAFYELFAGKDDLVLAVFEETIRMATRFFDEQISALSDPLQRLELIVTSLALGENATAAPDNGATGRMGGALSREHLRLAESRPDDLQGALEPLIALIARQLADGMEAGLVRRADPQRLAMLVYNLVSTTVHTELLAEERAMSDRAQREHLAADVWTFCRRGIAV